MAEDNIYDKNFRPMPIVDLIDGNHHFIIPSYQRGYRWEEKQVMDLLTDISSFSSESGKGDSYFLQPVVVKAVNETEGNWEVLDGQQRLTTMLLILKWVVKNLLSEMMRQVYEPFLYDIKYSNRPQLDFDNPKPEDNIDSYYLSTAKMVIDEWFKEQIRKKASLEDFTKALLYNDVPKQVKIIWYVIDENGRDLESIKIFNRLNKGRIALTSSELIKALFIMDYDIRAAGDKLPAERLSMEWNEMEKEFQKNDFWYFISQDSSAIQTRIDVLFDYVTRRDEGKDSDYSYREFQRLYDFCRQKEHEKDSSQKNDIPFESSWAEDVYNMQDAWKLVRRTFDKLVAWYEDSLHYHYVGYLIAVGYTPLQISNFMEDEMRSSKESKPEYEWTEDDTIASLRKMIMGKFKIKTEYLTVESINELEYPSEFIPRILLLFNVESCRIRENVRFSFNKFKTGTWDVEHVDPQNESTLQSFDDRKRWLENIEFILRRERESPRATGLADECHKLIEDFTAKERINIAKYNEFYITINKYYAAEGGESEEDVDLSTLHKDYLSNLTLLDSATNREYKDAPFAYKRYRIIGVDKAGNKFMPPCTRNLFLKYYSDSDRKSSFLDNMRWSRADREDYLKEIHRVVDPIFNSVNNGGETNE